MEGEQHGVGDLDAVIALFASANASEQPAGPGGVRGFLAEVAAQEIPADTTREAEVRGRRLDT